MRDKKKNYSWEETVQVLIEMFELPTRWRLYFSGVMMGGFRRGEMLAVEWSDIDNDRGAIWIEDQITFDEDGKKNRR